MKVDRLADPGLQLQLACSYRSDVPGEPNQRTANPPLVSHPVITILEEEAGWFRFTQPYLGVFSVAHLLPAQDGLRMGDTSQEWVEGKQERVVSKMLSRFSDSPEARLCRELKERCVSAQ